MVFSSIKVERPASLIMPINSKKLRDYKLSHSLSSLLSQNSETSLILVFEQEKDKKIIHAACSGYYTSLEIDNDNHRSLSLVYMTKAKRDGFIYLEGLKRLFTFGSGYGDDEIEDARQIVEEIEELTGSEIQELDLGPDL